MAMMWTKASRASPESYTVYSSRIQHSSNGRQRKDKRAKNCTTRWVSAQLLYVRISAWQQSWQCGKNLCRSFLWAVRFLSIQYITWCKFLYTRSLILIYVAQFFTYGDQKCNLVPSCKWFSQLTGRAWYNQMWKNRTCRYRENETWNSIQQKGMRVWSNLSHVCSYIRQPSTHATHSILYVHLFLVTAWVQDPCTI